MDVTLGSGTLTVTLADGLPQVYNLANMVDVSATVWKKYNTTPPAPSGNPYNQPTPTSVDMYKVTLHFNDNRWLDIVMGTVDNQASWTNDDTGAVNAVTDISNAI